MNVTTNVTMLDLTKTLMLMIIVVNMLVELLVWMTVENAMVRRSILYVPREIFRRKTRRRHCRF
jgi:hypothetical protein